METVLVLLVALLLGAVAVAFYMDWLGLWVSKEEMGAEIARAMERRRLLGQPLEGKVAATGAKAREETGTAAAGPRG